MESKRKQLQKLQLATWVASAGLHSLLLRSRRSYLVIWEFGFELGIDSGHNKDSAIINHHKLAAVIVARGRLQKQRQKEREIEEKEERKPNSLL
jgi:hypothetical protein